MQTTRALVRGIAIDGRGADHPRRHAGHLQAQAAARPRHGRERAGAAPPTPTLIALLIDVAQGRSTRKSTRSLDAASAGQGAARFSSSTRSTRSPAKAARAGANAQRARQVRGDLHDLGAERRRRRRSAQGAGAAHEALALALSRGSDLRRAAAAARRRDHPREDLSSGCTTNCPISRRSRPSPWTNQKDGSARIEQTIYVARDGQKKIVIGEGGRTIKAIGQAARREIAEAADQPVHLFLFVKVRENWTDDPERYREMRLDFPKGK